MKQKWKEKGCYLMKKLLAFLGIYAVTAIIAEAIIMFGFLVAGYHFWEGEMPEGIFVQNLLPLYGFAFFSINTMIYCRVIEKRKPSDMGICFNIKMVSDYIKGLLMSAFGLCLIFIMMCRIGAYAFSGLGDFSLKWCMLSFAAFLIQATGEEIMCRGFLMTSLHKRFTREASIAVSSLAFLVPHIFSLPGGITGVLSVINLLLISVFFSCLFWRYDTIGVCSGFHAGWNFIVSYLCGLQLSGRNAAASVINLTVVSENPILTGGEYGIEASGVVTVLLCILLLLVKRQFHSGECTIENF